MGDYVVSHRGEEVGQVESIMLEVASGRVAHALVACGGVFGIGVRRYAIPWNLFTIDVEHRRLLLTVELTHLRTSAAPFVNSDRV